MVWTTTYYTTSPVDESVSNNYNNNLTISALKWVWPSMNQFRMFFMQTATPPPRMHQKLTKHGKFCKQNNQLPTKTRVELKDNSNINIFIGLLTTTRFTCCTLRHIWVRVFPPGTTPISPMGSNLSMDNGYNNLCPQHTVTYSLACPKAFRRMQIFPPPPATKLVLVCWLMSCSSSGTTTHAYQITKERKKSNVRS